MNISIGYVAFGLDSWNNLSSSLTSIQQSTATMEIGGDMEWGARHGVNTPKYRQNDVYAHWKSDDGIITQ